MYCHEPVALLESGLDLLAQMEKEEETEGRIVLLEPGLEEGGTSPSRPNFIHFGKRSGPSPPTLPQWTLGRVLISP